ncbi:hypothetical protein LCGC14_0732080 [marine sediment metagenome]|uniref:Adenine methyltransferase n=1 Tax=marine sediment metagenome TaxID=412755 RepID=A0A0F9QU94_9ZZZZ
MGHTKHKAMLTSLNQDWRTPKRIYEELNKEFKFKFDPCPSNAKFNGLEIEWKKSNYCNPPYTTKIQNAFVKKAWEESRKGKLCVLLLPVRTSSKRWQKYILPYATEIRFLAGRLKFNDGTGGSTFCSAVVIFDGKKK